MNNKAHLRPKDFDSNGDIIPMACKEEKGDLISREALKTEMQKVYPLATNGFGHQVNSEIYKIIDNAPTVEAIPNEEGYEMYGKGYLQGYERGKNEKQGKWINESISFGCGDAECSNCHEKAEMIVKNTGWGYDYSSYNFCPNCGADMKGGAE